MMCERPPRSLRSRLPLTRGRLRHSPLVRGRAAERRQGVAHKPYFSLGNSSGSIKDAAFAATSLSVQIPQQLAECYSRPSMKQYLFPDGCQFGRDNLVLHASARRHRVENIHGPLSIKRVIDGQVTCIVDRRELVVDAGSFLVVNDGKVYSMNLEARENAWEC